MLQLRFDYNSYYPISEISTKSSNASPVMYYREIVQDPSSFTRSVRSTEITMSEKNTFIRKLPIVVRILFNILQFHSQPIRNSLTYNYLLLLYTRMEYYFITFVTDHIGNVFFFFILQYAGRWLYNNNDVYTRLSVYFYTRASKNHDRF